MKKPTAPKKLHLRSESLKQLNISELQNAAGGALSTPPLICPTTTVLPTGDC